MKYLMYRHVFMQGSCEISPLVLISMCRMVLHKGVIAARFRLNLYPLLPFLAHQQLPYFLSKTSLRAMTVPVAIAKLEMTIQQQGRATFQCGTT